MSEEIKRIIDDLETRREKLVGLGDKGPYLRGVLEGAEAAYNYAIEQLRMIL